MAVDASPDDRRELERLGATRVHIAGKEEYPGYALGLLRGQHQRDAGPIAPTDKRRPLQTQVIHHRHHVGGHQLIGIRPLVARAAAVAAAIDDDNAIAGFDQRRNLIAPVATVAQPAVQ